VQQFIADDDANRSRSGAVGEDVDALAAILFIIAVALLF
jgi:hypothetical protein